MTEALAILQTRLPHITKGETARVTSERTGKTHTYTYATLADVTHAIMPVLGELGLSFTATPTLIGGGQFVLAYKLRHTSGGQVSGIYPLGTGTPQQIGSAITYARRYCLCAVTGVAPDDDDDDGATAPPADPPGSVWGMGDPDSITPQQSRAMHAAFARAQITDRAERLGFTAGAVGREVASSADLTYSEAARLLSALEEKGKGQ